MFPSVFALRVAEVSHRSQHGGLAKEGKSHSRSRTCRENTLASFPIDRHVEVRTQKWAYIIAIDAKTEDVYVHGKNPVTEATTEILSSDAGPSLLSAVESGTRRRVRLEPGEEPIARPAPRRLKRPPRCGSMSKIVPERCQPRHAIDE
jgi:hypothetical protein